MQFWLKGFAVLCVTLCAFNAYAEENEEQPVAIEQPAVETEVASSNVSSATDEPTFQAFIGLLPRIGMAGGRFFDYAQSEETTIENPNGNDRIFNKQINNGLFYEMDWFDLGFSTKLEDYKFSLSWTFVSISGRKAGRSSMMSGHRTFTLGVERRPYAIDLTYGWDFAKQFRIRTRYFCDFLGLGESFDPAVQLMYSRFWVDEENREVKTDNILAAVETTYTNIGWFLPTVELGVLYQQLQEYFTEPGYTGYLETGYATGNIGVWLGLRMRFAPAWASF
jgi:hypothetical protein